ncbi:MAG: anion permease, partial [Myxococcales bacterium]|nr:anion permease [Myxococcales bacterium]
ALAIIATIGTAPMHLLLGFMVANAALSMWISNTASVLVALPIAMSVIEEARVSHAPPSTPAAAPGSEAALARFATALMLGIAYAADIGGMATLVGTPPNLVYAELQAQLLPDTPPVSFGQWMMFGLPLSIVFLVVGWRLLGARLFRVHELELFTGADLLARTRAELGPVTRDERLAAGI